MSHEKAKTAPAWEDPDDATQSVDISAVPRLRKLRKTENEASVDGGVYADRLRDQFEKLQQGPMTWAKRKRRKGSYDDDESDDDDLVGRKQAAFKIKRDSSVLPPERISVARVKDANVAEPSSVVIQSVEFHPRAPLLLTAGLDKTLRLFQVDGVRNPKVQSLHLSDLPIHTAAFSGDGTQIICAGRRKYFYVADVHSGIVDKVTGIIGRPERSFERFIVSPDNSCIAFYGNDGYIVLVSMKTKQWVGNMKMNGSFRCGAFSNDSMTFYSAGGDGRVHMWDMRKRECVKVYDDEGSNGSTSLAVSADHHAIGANSGVVNLYDSRGPLQRPEKAFMNLRTAVDSLKFNSTGEILAMASRMKRGALRLVHVPSMTVFANWPTHNTPMRYVHSIAFSPNSGYFAMGNDRGNVLLYRLNHFVSM